MSVDDKEIMAVIKTEFDLTGEELMNENDEGDMFFNTEDEMGVGLRLFPDFHPLSLSLNNPLKERDEVSDLFEGGKTKVKSTLSASSSVVTSFEQEMEQNVREVVDECIIVLHKDPREYHPFYLRVYKYLCAGVEQGVFRTEQMDSIWQRYDSLAEIEYTKFLTQGVTTKPKEFTGPKSAYLNYILTRKVFHRGKEIRLTRNQSEREKGIRDLEELGKNILTTRKSMDIRQNLKARLEFFEHCRVMTFPGDTVRMNNLWTKFITTWSALVTDGKDKRQGKRGRKPKSIKKHQEPILIAPDALVLSSELMHQTIESATQTMDVSEREIKQEVDDIIIPDQEPATLNNDEKRRKRKALTGGEKLKATAADTQRKRIYRSKMSEDQKAIERAKNRVRTKLKRKSMNDTEKMEARSKAALQSKQKRDSILQSLSAEGQEAFREKERTRRRLREAAYTEDQKQKIRMSRYMYSVARKATLGPDEIKKRNRRRREQKKLQYQTLTEEDKVRLREGQQRWRQSLSGEKKKKYLESVKKAVIKNYHKSKEDPRKWSEKMEKLKAYQRHRTATETPEDRQKRLTRYKIYQAKKKLRKQLESQGVDTQEIERRLGELAYGITAKAPTLVSEKRQEGYKPRIHARNTRKPQTPSVRKVEEDKTDHIFLEQLESQPIIEEIVYSSIPAQSCLFPGGVAVEYSICTSVSATSTSGGDVYLPIQYTLPNPPVHIEGLQETSYLLPMYSSEIPTLQLVNHGTEITLPEETVIPEPLEPHPVSHSITVSSTYELPSEPLLPPLEGEHEVSTVAMIEEPFQQYEDADDDDEDDNDSDFVQSIPCSENARSQDTNVDLITNSRPSTPKKKRDIICDECGNMYSSVYMPVHKNIKHNPNRAISKCPQCPMEFKKGRSLWHHFFKMHMDNGAPQPPQSATTELSEYKSELNPPEPTKDPQLYCESCGQSFYEEAQLRRHFYYSHGKGSQPENFRNCVHCGKSFKQKCSLDDHIRRVHEGHNFRCEVCSKDCQSIGKLWRHKVDAHGMTDLPPPADVMLCNYCGEKILRGYESHVKKRHPDMLEHYKTVLATVRVKKRSVKPSLAINASVIDCPKCNKEIAKGSLTRHLRNVHGIGDKKKFPCSVCGKEFKERYHLNEHVREQHDNLEKRIEDNKLIKYIRQRVSNESVKMCAICMMCGEKFREKFELRAHLVTRHPHIYEKLKSTDGNIPMECEQCHEQFPTDIELRGHIKSSHPDNCWQCPECDKVLLNSFEMEEHFKDEHNEGIQEDEWGLDDAGKRIRVKWKPKNSNVYGLRVRCLRCDARFKTTGELNSHVKNKHPHCYFPCDYCHAMKYTETGQQFHVQLCKKRPKSDGVVIDGKVHKSNDYDIGNKKLFDKVEVSCELCGQRVEMYCLQPHYKSAHGITENVWRCDDDNCKKVFKKRQYWLGHLSLQHGTSMEELVVMGQKLNCKDSSRLKNAKDEKTSGNVLKKRGRKQNEPTTKPRRNVCLKTKTSFLETTRSKVKTDMDTDTPAEPAVAQRKSARIRQSQKLIYHNEFMSETESETDEDHVQNTRLNGKDKIMEIKVVKMSDEQMEKYLKNPSYVHKLKDMKSTK